MTKTSELRKEVSQAFDVAKGVGGMLGQVAYAIWTLASKPAPEPPKRSLTERIVADPAGFAASHEKLIWRYAVKSQRHGEVRTANRNLRSRLADSEKLVADLREQRDHLRKHNATQRKIIGELSRYIPGVEKLSEEDADAVATLRESIRLDDHGEYNGEGDLTRSMGEAVANGAA